jgi:curli production assembly/transport component CsgG
MIAIVLAVLMAQRTLAYDEQLTAASAKMSTALIKTKRHTAAVIDFTDLRGNVTELGRFLAERLSVSLASEIADHGGTVEIIDRTHLKAILQEHKLAASGLIDIQTVQQVGKIAGADTLITGTLTPLGDSVNLTVKGLDSETAHLVASASVDIPKTKAIEDLLNREIADPSKSSSKPALVAPNEIPVVKVTAGSLVAEFKGCSRKGDKATCFGKLTNIGSQELEFFEDTYVRSIVDDRGIETKDFDVWIGTHGNNERVQMEPDLPIRFVIGNISVAPAATELNIHLRMCEFDRGVPCNVYTVSLRNLPVSP